MGTLGKGRHSLYPGSPDGTIATALRALDALIAQRIDDERACLVADELLTLSPADLVRRVAAQLSQAGGSLPPKAE